MTLVLQNVRNGHFGITEVLGGGSGDCIYVVSDRCLQQNLMSNEIIIHHQCGCIFYVGVQRPFGVIIGQTRFSFSHECQRLQPFEWGFLEFQSTLRRVCTHTQFNTESGNCQQINQSINQPCPFQCIINKSITVILLVAK